VPQEFVPKSHSFTVICGYYRDWFVKNSCTTLIFFANGEYDHPPPDVFFLNHFFRASTFPCEVIDLAAPIQGLGGAGWLWSIFFGDKMDKLVFILLDGSFSFFFITWSIFFCE
jgi:hypothetical protein